MTKEELEKEAEEIYLKTDKEFMDCQDEGEIFNLGYLAGAEPREKRIAELEDKLANADYQLEGRDNEIRKFEKENKVLAQNLEDTEIINNALEKENAELKTRVSEQSERISELTQELDDEINRLG